MIPEMPSRNIDELMSDLRDISEDLDQQQAQVRFLLWQCV